jgi:hypothetical protein
MRRLIPSLALGVLLIFCCAPPAWAAFGINNFDVTFTGPKGEVVTQAGSHPFAMSTTFNVETEKTGSGGLRLAAAVKDLLTTQIEGLVGNPTAVPPCKTADFLTRKVSPGKFYVGDCPDSAAVGTVATESIAEEAPGEGAIYSAVYSLEPPPGVAAKLGFWNGGLPVTIELGVSGSPPYNIVGGPSNISQIIEVYGADLTLWGAPADPAHDSERGICLDGTGISLGQCPANISAKPFLTLPRACTGPLATTWKADSWPNPGVFLKGSVLTHDEAGNPRGMSGCGVLGFAPETSALPSTRSAESAAGIDISIDVNDEGLTNPEGVAQADIKGMQIALPSGITANPGAAEGLGVCTKAQYEAESLTVHGCPDASKLGSIEAQTPILENHTLRGSVYLAQQDDPATVIPGAENPFDSLIALYIVIRDPQVGAFVKLAAEVSPDPKTGQLITTIKDMPPFPLSHVVTHLRSGPRAPLITPPLCGTYTTTTLLTPSSGAPPLPTNSSFKIDSGPGGGPCPGGGAPPFSPGFEAGSENNAASAYSPFSLRLTRGDGEQDLTRFSATLPPGMSGKLAGVTKCTDAEIALAKAKSGRQEQALPSCPGASQIGHVIAGAGVGNDLTFVPGSVYLAGPYGGDPLSVAAIVPAVAGPFDAGTVVTRVALTLNQNTAEVEVDGANSDPIPHILKGIPLKVRDIRIYTDRPNFTLNPTSCTPSATRAEIFGSGVDLFDPADDLPVARSSRFQAASCASLGFTPKVALSLTGGTKRDKNPALHSSVTYPYPSGPGYANIGKAVVTLPPSEFIDPEHINNPCTRVQFNANACPANSILGSAKATTPLLDEPLEGPVYFRSNGGERKLPDVVADLHGLVHIILIGVVDTATPKTNPRIRTTFATVPDAPVSKFTIDLKGGKQGLLVNNRNLCAHKLRSTVELTGQNGRQYDTRPLVRTSCTKGKSKRRSAQKSR